VQQLCITARAGRPQQACVTARVQMLQCTRGTYDDVIVLECLIEMRDKQAQNIEEAWKANRDL